MKGFLTMVNEVVKYGVIKIFIAFAFEMQKKLF